MAKMEISWKGRTADGKRRLVYAERMGGAWTFYSREKRYEQWEPLPHPPLADWLELLDGVRRRIDRRLLPPQEADRLKRSIRQQYPDADLTGAQ